jgi:hypothetical protein
MSLTLKTQQKACISVNDSMKVDKKPASTKTTKKYDDDEESKVDQEMAQTEDENASQEIEMIDTMSKGRIPAT